MHWSPLFVRRTRTAVDVVGGCYQASAVYTRGNESGHVGHHFDT